MLGIAQNLFYCLCLLIIKPLGPWLSLFLQDYVWISFNIQSFAFSKEWKKFNMFYYYILAP